MRSLDASGVLRGEHPISELHRWLTGLFVFDPRMFITGPFRLCPRCGKYGLGTLSISNNFHQRRCRNCFYNEGERLPRLHKKLIYLDQMVLSNIAKELDPVWRGTNRRPDPFWLDLFDQLDRLVKLQLIVCPESPVHEEESAYDDRYEAVLRRLHQHLASGVSLDFPHQVLTRQLWEALEASLEDREPEWDCITPKNIVDGDLGHWNDRLLLTVNMGHWVGQINDRRSSRARAHNALRQLWERWQAESDINFEERFEKERRGIAEAALESYRSHLHRWYRASTGAEEIADIMALTPGWLVQLVMGLLSRFKEAGVPPQEQLNRVMEFLYSEAALRAPQNHISSLLYASLARRAASGQKRLPSRGTPNDIEVISGYLPYCDAMFIDDEFAQLLIEQPLAREIKPYATRVFSTRSRDVFLAYLESLEAEASPEHVQLVTCTYGDGWVEPFRSILEHERNRNASQ